MVYKTENFRLGDRPAPQSAVNEVKFVLFPFYNLRGNIDFGRSSVPHFTVLTLPRHAILWDDQ
jgi:hypothetical protein